MTHRFLSTVIVLCTGLLITCGSKSPTSNNVDTVTGNPHGYSATVDNAIIGTWILVDNSLDTITGGLKYLFTGTAWSQQTSTGMITKLLPQTGIGYTELLFANKGKIGVHYVIENVDYFIGQYDYSIRDTLNKKFIVIRAAIGDTSAARPVYFSDVNASTTSAWVKQ
jgi:hypothetical protein